MANKAQVLDTLARTNREVLRRKAEQSEEARKIVLDRFPRSDWPSMPLERYAQGDATSVEAPFCTVMEFHTPALGSIKGGSAAKHMIYRHNSGEWRLAAPLKGLDAELAWEMLRSEFVKAFDAIEAEDFDALDELKVLHSGQSLATKTFVTYYPQHFAAVYGQDHLRWFIRRLGEEPLRAAASWSLNRQLRSLLGPLSESTGLSPFEAVRALYTHFPPPREAQIIKIAPGRNATWWDLCRERSMIGVGWNQVGDLTQYASADELREALDSKVKISQYNSTLARYLLQFRDLRPGDQVVANRGEREILGLGTVTGGYRHELADEDHPSNLVEVEWDTGFELRLVQPAPGWRQTFGRVPQDLLKQLQMIRDAQPGNTQSVASRAPAEVEGVAKAAKKKGQVILHGPPGTGKTRLALRAALELTGAYPDSEEAVSDAIREMLDDGSRAMLTTFHPSYGYEDFIEGFKPVHADDGGLKLELRRGLFLNACDEARKNSSQPYALIIDEINRGDLPRVFGELITMLETDKRQLSVRLPVSGEIFGIPDNLHIIATLNSADHSVTSLDIAIRRRFSFVRLDPDPDVLTGAVDALDLAAFLRELNSRIRAHLSADLEIGHAYLLRYDRPIDTAADLASAFYNELVPLLEDYTFDRPEILGRLLGSMIDEQTGSVKTFEPGDLADALASEFAADGDE